MDQKIQYHGSVIILSTVIICAFRIFSKTPKLKTYASRFADKKRFAKPFYKTQIMAAGSQNGGFHPPYRGLRIGRYDEII